MRIVGENRDQDRRVLLGRHRIVHRDWRIIDRVNDDGQCSGVCSGAVRHGVGDGVCAIEVGGRGVVDSGVIRVDGSGSGP